MRRAARKDANHKTIVQDLEKGIFGVQYTVIDLSQAGNGIPDIWIPHMGFNFLIEIKDPSKPKSARELTSAQVKLHEKAKKGQVSTFLTSQEIHDYIQSMLIKYGLKQND